MKTVRMKKSNPSGMTGKLATNLTRNWLIGLPENNPAILDIFRERDLLPYRDLLPWSGEFAGKYITGAYYIYRLTLDQELYAYILKFIDQMIGCQAENGYLGCYNEANQFTGSFSNIAGKEGGTWDAWNHYHIMYGLLLWYDETGDERYLDTTEKIAALLMNHFYTEAAGGKRLVEIGDSEMNLAPIHSFALLYNLTDKQCYLDFALEIEKDTADERAGNYLYYAQNGLEYYQCPKPRWESMHIILGFTELYRATRKAYYLQAAEQIFRSILKTDVHNTGAFSTNEQAVGHPFGTGSIETCCVIAYNALALELYKLTKDPTILDFLELSHYNACMGFWSPTGRWSTYDTPMNGSRKASFHDVVFQCRPGSPELNCCSVNAARGIGMISEWALTREEQTLYLNAYEDLTCETEDGCLIEITGGYPARNEITIHVKNYIGTLALRIPAWSSETNLTIHTGSGHTDCRAVPSGSYYPLQCMGETTIQLSLDFTTRYAEGDLDFKGYVSVYRGPVLFGTDVTLAGGHNVQELPALNKTVLENTPALTEEDRILIPLEQGITLGDFYHLGASGCQYVTWLKINA